MAVSTTIKQELIGLVKSTLRGMGMEISRIPANSSSLQSRPIGWMSCFLEDLKARNFAPRSILDVGANRGDWSRLAVKNFPDASFVLVDPLQEMVTHLQRFCSEYPKARHVQAGAGALEGELVLTVSEDLAGSSFLESPPEGASNAKSVSRKIKIVTLDSLYDDKTPLPDLVKLDVQGFELEALKGAKKFFGHTELFILEVALIKLGPALPIVSEVVEFLAKAGYEVYDLPGYLRRPLDGALGQIDIAFAKRDGFLRRSTKW